MRIGYGEGEGYERCRLLPSEHIVLSAVDTGTCLGGVLPASRAGGLRRWRTQSPLIRALGEARIAACGSAGRIVIGQLQMKPFGDCALQSLIMSAR
jgi:hypothetical protein